MSEERRKLGWVLGILAGIAAVLYGLGMAADDKVRCGNQVQGADDVCVSTDLKTGESSEFSQEEQRASNRGGGYLVAGIGGLVLLGTGFSIYRHTRRRKGPSPATVAAADPGPARAALAAEHGWNFRAAEPDLALIAGWRFGTFDRDEPGRRIGEVIRGERDGYPFEIFDYSCFSTTWQRQETTTVWAVRVPYQESGPLADWFAAGRNRRFHKRPVVITYAGDGVVCAVRGGGLGKRQAEWLLPGLERTIELVAAFRAETGSKPHPDADRR